MPGHSAGLLPYLVDDQGLHVFIAHPGGPFFARRDEGAWSVVKGEFDPAVEDARAAAGREWVEETGADVPPGAWLALGEIRQAGGKIVTAFAVAATRECAFVASNAFDLEWPPRSGRTIRVPEIDRAEWCPVAVAATRLNPAQVPLLDRLTALL